MWAAIVIIVIALLLVLMAPKPKVENARAANLGDFQFPRSKEGDPVMWFLGTVRVRSPNSLWYGDYTPVPIKKKQKTGLFSSKKVTVGYKYHIGLDLCWGLGGPHPVTLRKLWSDKYVFWQGTASTAQTLTISGKANLFGGPEQRGGLAGRIDYYPGTFNETRNSYLAQKADPDVPAYVGQCRTVFRGNLATYNAGSDPENSGVTLGSGFYFGTTTSINAIHAEMTRLSSNVHPTYSIMPNGLDVNPMELLHAGFTEKFGMPGIDASNIDLPSWQACAQTLYNEGFGMSLLVQQSITGKDLCEEVLRIADGILYQDTDSGKIVAKLIRDDYDIETLPVLDQSIVKELVNLNKTTWEQTYNQCRVTFKDRANDYADRVATQQDFANINFQQRVKNIDISVPGCFLNEEATKLAARQLSLLSVPLFQMELRCNRRASLMKPGDVFVFEWGPYGISNMVMRVQKIDKGTLTDGTVTINCVQDRFATALAVFAPPTGSGWTPVSSAAQPVVDRLFFETPKWFHQFFDTPPAANQAAPYVVAKPPGSASVGMDIEVSGNGTYSDVVLAGDDYPYDGSFLLQTAMADTVGRDTGYTGAAGFTIELVDVPTELQDQNGSFDTTGQFLVLMNGEFMQIANITDNGNGTYFCYNIYRALLDTHFFTHAIGSRGYLVKQSDGLLPVYLADNGATFYGRIRDITPSDTLPPEQALTNSFVTAQRAARPAPPDYVTIDGSRTPSSVAAGTTVTLAWRARNRNNVAIVAYNAASETQEAGVDYGWRYRVGAGAWSGYTYTASLTAVAPVPAAAGIVEYEVWSRKDGALLSRVGDNCFVEAVVPAPTDDFALAVLADSPRWYAKHNESVNATGCVNYGSAGTGTYVTKLSNSAAPIFTGGDLCWNNTASDYCNITFDALPAGTDEFTLEIVVNENTLSSFQALIDRDPESGTRIWQWRLTNTGSMEFIRLIGGVQTISAAAVVTAGTTAILGVRLKTDGELTLWKNGAIVATGTMPTGLEWGSGSLGLRVLRRLQGDSANNAKCAASIIYDYALSDARMLVHAQEAGLAP